MPPTNARRWLAGVYLMLVLLVTWQRGIERTDHKTFAIFRQSFVHLVENRDLYAPYPEEQGAEVRDLFKYSPTAAVFFAPLAALPYAPALFIWCLLNAGLLFYAVTRVVPRREAHIALACLAPEVFASMQAESSNGIIAGLMLLGLHFILSGRHARASLAIGAATAMKVFPIAIALAAIPRGRVLRFSLMMAAAGVVLLALPLLVVPLTELQRQYASWYSLERSDGRDLVFGLSLIRVLRTLWPNTIENWTFQVVGAVLVMVPLMRRERWSDPSFQLRLGCSVMLFAVLFNHQAERASFIIAAVGVAIWLSLRPPSVSLVAAFALAMSGVSVLPYFVLWVAMQCDLIADGDPAVAVVAPKTQSVFWGSWSLRGMPDVLARTLLIVALLDGVTPQHLIFPRNLWDLMR